MGVIQGNLADFSASNPALLPSNYKWFCEPQAEALILVALKGGLRISTALCEIEASPSYAVYLPAGIDFDMATGGPAAEVYTISLSITGAASGSTQADRPFRLEDSHPYFLIAAIISQADQHPQLTANYIGQLADYINNRPPEPEADWSSNVIGAISMSVQSAPSLNELASLVDVHPMTLTKRFRQRHGCSIGDFRLRMRAERAFYRIIKQASPLSELSLVCGFADQSHMTRELRRFFALTPASLRNLSAATRVY